MSEREKSDALEQYEAFVDRCNRITDRDIDEAAMRDACKKVMGRLAEEHTSGRKLSSAAEILGDQRVGVHLRNKPGIG